MTFLVTYLLTGVDGKASVDGKESNTKSLTRSTKRMMGIMMMVKMKK